MWQVPLERWYIGNLYWSRCRSWLGGLGPLQPAHLRVDPVAARLAPAQELQWPEQRELETEAGGSPGSAGATTISGVSCAITM